MAYKVPPFVFQAPALDVSTGEMGRGWLWAEAAWSLQMRGDWREVGRGRGPPGLREEWVGAPKVPSIWG